MVDHVIACCQGRETSRLSPASVLDALQLTLDVNSTLAAPKRAMTGAAEPGASGASRADSCHLRGIASP